MNSNLVSFLNFGLNIIIQVIGKILDVILSPFANWWNENNSLLFAIQDFCTLIEKPLQFIIGWLNISPNLLAMFVSYYFLRLSLYLTINISKIVYGWIRGYVHLK